MRKRMAISLLFWLLLAPVWSASAQESGPVITLQATVTGNQEQPQVLYIVPWQSPESPVLPYSGVASQLEEVFGHMDREALRRTLETFGDNAHKSSP